MKRFSCFLMMAAMAASVAAVSCSKDDTTSTKSSISLSKTSLIATYEGGIYSFGYTLNNPTDDGVLKVEADEPWISDFDLSVEDTVFFNVAMQEERSVRSSAITLNYIDGADTLATRTVNVTQDLNNYYGFEASVAGGLYYGVSNIYNNEGNLQFSVWLSDTPLGEDGTMAAGGTYYVLDIWTSTVPDGTNYVYLPEGEYVFGQVGENGVFSKDSGYYVVNEDGDDYDEEYGFVSGTVTVKRSGTTTTITADMEDSNGGVHEMTYSGDLTLENESLISTLDGDYDLGDFSDIACDARYYGDYYRTGTANWVLNIYPETGTGITIDYCGDSACTYDSGTIPVGTFSASDTGGGLGYFLSGSLFSNYLSGTWLVTLDGDGSLTAPYAPIAGGTVQVTSSDGVYTVKVSVTDDRDYAVTGEWTGTPTLSDYTTTSSLSSTSSKIRRVKTTIPFRRASPFSL